MADAMRVEVAPRLAVQADSPVAEPVGQRPDANGVSDHRVAWKVTGPHEPPERRIAHLANPQSGLREVAGQNPIETAQIPRVENNVQPTQAAEQGQQQAAAPDVQ